MIVHRIVTDEFSGSLKASGRPARWNSTDSKMIYSAGSVSLACLENIVHRSGEGLSSLFKILEIDIPDGLARDVIRIEELPENWTDSANIHITRKIGDKWLKSMTSAVCRVPSAIIHMESNYLINPAHKDFKSIRLVNAVDFNFDKRIK